MTDNNTREHLSEYLTKPEIDLIIMARTLGQYEKIEIKLVLDEKRKKSLMVTKTSTEKSYIDLD